MIIRIKLELEKPELPKDYRPSIVSFFKAVISKNYPEEYEKLYGADPNMKPFTFAVTLPSPKFTDSGIILAGSDFQIAISFADEKSSLLFYNSFQKSKSYIHPLQDENSFSIQSIQLEPSPLVTQNEVMVKFISPLVVRKHEKGKKDRYYIWEDEEFQSCLNYSVFRQLGKETDVLLKPIAPKKTVVLAFGVKIRCTIGTFLLQSDVNTINELLKGGLGSRRSQGFGFMIVTGGR